MPDEPLKPEHATWAILAEVFKPDGDANAVLYAAHRLQKLVGEDPDAPVKPGPRSFVLVTNGGHWGRGNTLQSAATNASNAGASKAELCVGVLVLNDNTPAVNQAGSVISNSDSAQLNIGAVGTIGSILRANKKPD